MAIGSLEEGTASLSVQFGHQCQLLGGPLLLGVRLATRLLWEGLVELYIDD